MMTHAEIAALLADQVDGRHKSVGIVAGIVSPEGRRVVSHGVTARGGHVPVDGGTAFELASISKVFTGLLLADMARAGEVTLTDAVDSLLPAGMKAPAWKGRPMTLLDLATHTAGLPPQPPDVPTLDDPKLAAYSVDRLFRSLSAYTLTRPPGTWEYGNWDISVLGHLLARRAGVDFETLVEQRITGPLGMSNTAVERTGTMRLTSSHSADLAVIPRLGLGSLAPAGAIISTADDMLTLAAALLGLTASPLGGLLDVMAGERRPIRPPLARMLKENWRLMLRMIFSPPRGARRPVRYFTGAEAGLAWFIFRKGNSEMLVHDGGAPGCSATLAIDRRARTAVVVLSNTGIGIHDVAPHLLWNDYPLSRTRTEVSVAPAVLERYVGAYQIPGGPPFAIKRGNGRLAISFPVIGDLVLRAENEREFFVAELGFEFRFAADGPIREVVMRPGRGQPDVPVPIVTHAA